jgi:MFS family permease
LNFLATPLRRKILFASLYFSEGAPIGFIWLAMPTHLRAEGVPIEQITWLTAIVVLPWTFKFAWAPLIDFWRSSRWSIRHWIIAAQSVMGLTLLPLCWIDPVEQFQLLAVLLVAHAIAAATQDVAIDALCIGATVPQERGEYNGWMQTGMLVGRSLMGGGALVMARIFGYPIVIGLLIFLTTFSMLLVLMSDAPLLEAGRSISKSVWQSAGVAIRTAATWYGLAFGLLSGAGFKSLEVIYGPFLIDRGFLSIEVGWFSAGPMIFAMICGSLIGGRIADRLSRKTFVAIALVYLAIAITLLGLSDYWMQSKMGMHLVVILAAIAFGIGLFTAAVYALFMDLTRPEIAATQFSAYMGATNGCESWSCYLIGQLIPHLGYAASFLILSGLSLLALPLLLMMNPRRDAALQMAATTAESFE